MTKNNKLVTRFSDDLSLASYINANYITQIKNFFGDDKKAMKFLSSVRADVQRTPKLLDCTPDSLVNSYITMAQMGFLPSNISGETYVLPYNIKGQMVAQLQVGYQGFVTLLYTAGVTKITSDIVRKNDKVSLVNGEMRHEIDPTLSNKERGEAIGAYVSVLFRGEVSTRYMNAKDILAHGQKFSKSFSPTGQFSPWNPANDPELNMWRKTVLKQMQKFLPKNEIIYKAIEIDNKDSIIADRLEVASQDSQNLKMGNLLTTNEIKNDNKEKEGGEENQDEVPSAESDEINPFKGE